ncbi:hypothetical protein LCGC14_2134490, partial [marine sediment metagenome]
MRCPDTLETEVTRLGKEKTDGDETTDPESNS